MIIFKYRKFALLFFVFALVYLAQSAFISPDKSVLEKYNITEGQAALLSLTIAVPYILIWSAALVGYLRLRSYAEPIKDTKDGAAFWTIAKGLLLLVLWLPLSAIISGLGTHFYNAHPASTANFIRFDNYFNIILLLPAFYIINRGTRRLLSIVRMPVFWYSEKAILMFLAFAAFYVFIVLEDPARLHATHSSRVASYYLADWLIVATIIIPRLIMWFWGLQAALNIYQYKKKVKGTLYNKALNNLAIGLTGVVISVIAIRCMQSLSSQLNELSLGLLLLLLYGLLLLLSVGYLYLASGAKHLQKIENS